MHLLTNLDNPNLSLILLKSYASRLSLTLSLELTQHNVWWTEIL